MPSGETPRLEPIPTDTKKESVPKPTENVKDVRKGTGQNVLRRKGKGGMWSESRGKKRNAGTLEPVGNELAPFRAPSYVNFGYFCFWRSETNLLCERTGNGREVYQRRVQMPLFTWLRGYIKTTKERVAPAIPRRITRIAGISSTSGGH